MEEKLKQDWRETRFSSGSDPDRMADIMDGRRRTALENLALRYRRFSALGFVMAGISCLCYRNPLFGTLAPWIATAMTAYFLLCGVTDYWFFRGVRSIDVTTMPIAVVAAKAAYYRKRHLQSIAVFAPLAMALIGGFVCASTGDKWFLSGVIAGGLVGLAIGLTQLKNFMDDYRNLSE